ncbi:MAG: DUF11 domain-containing protein [Saprospiraceae bacterium]|nr:DUF11 domain-containing protein [Saprospiraceae bacterium]
MNKSFLKMPLIFLLLAFFYNTLSAQFDLALRLNTITSSPVKYGTSVPFNITVFNQGNQAVDSIDIICYINPALQFGSGNGIWTPDGVVPNAYVTRIAGELDPAASVLVTINLVPNPGTDSTQWNLAAEIFAFQDISGNNVEDVDIDSQSDKNRSNDGGGAIGQASDDAINGNGTGLPGSASAATDEDDHDVAKVRIYDLAMRKVLTSVGPFEYGDTLTFTHTVYNQGNETSGLVTIQELVTEGYAWDGPLNAPLGWTGTLPKPKYSFQSLKPFTSIDIPVKLILDPEMFDGMAWNNYSEIFAIRDLNNVNVGPNEADSSPNSNSTYENQVLPGSAFDNEINGNGQSENEDEDDHDVAAPRIFDLAIKKERQTAVPSYSYTQNVNYTIIVYNQGNVTANQVTVTDTVPCGLEFLPALNPGWTISGPNKVSFTQSGPILPASFVTLNLLFGVNPCYNNPATGWTNYVEISNAVPADGGSNDDIDGTFDSTLNNDYQYDNLANNDVLDKLGTEVNQDEDNHDLEIIQVVDMALKKVLTTPPPYTYGQNLTFTITLYNQGNVPLKNIRVKDYIPEGYSYSAANNIGFGWNMADTTNTILGPMYPLDTVDLKIVLTVEHGNSRRDWFNYSHIVNVQDLFNNNRNDDADSYSFTVNATEFTIDPGDPEDDDIFVLGPPNTNRDEDDHDPAGFEVMDLALTKLIINPQPFYIYGDIVPFTIRVVNQGGTTTSFIQVTDYLPCGLSFSPANNPGWSQSGNLLRYQSAAYLKAGETLELTLNLVIQPCAATNAWRNVAEISIARDSLSTNNDDFDSDPDENPLNDPQGEDDIDDETIIPLNGEIGGIVWYDINANGIYQAGEPFTPNIQVELWDCNGNLIKSTLTDGSGAYLFKDLQGGNYQVRFIQATLPPNNLFTLQNAGSDDDLDSDCNGIGHASCFTLLPGQSNYTIDAGHFAPSSIGDFVWNDINGNGIQDFGENGIPGVLVSLYSSTGLPLSTTNTDASGYYIFDNLLPGSFYLVFNNPVNYDFNDANVGFNDNVDSDVDGSQGIGSTAIFFVPAGTNITNMDAGLVKCAEISGLVFYDADKDDLLDATENGINGMRIELYRFFNNTWVLTSHTVTGHKPGTPSDDGYFYFCSAPGVYYLKVIMPPYGLVQARPNVLGEQPLEASNEYAIDSDLTNNYGVGTTRSFTITSGQVIRNIGAGYYPMATAGNLVWEDTNFNGRQDVSEPKVANVRVEAFDVYNQKIGEAITDNTGTYTITYLAKADYYLKFTPPAGYGYTMSNQGNEEIDSDVDHTNGLNTTRYFAMKPGVNYLSIDAGLAPGALPVRYISLDAHRHGEFNIIEWKTATEINSEYFTIERFNEETKTFYAIGEVKASGNSTVEKAYLFEDHDALKSGKYTYRLAQADYDGSVSYSDQVSVLVRGKSTSDFVLSPNPARERCILSLSAPADQEVIQITISQANGIVVYNARYANIGSFELPLKGFASGVYDVCVEYPGQVMCKKLIIME